MRIDIFMALWGHEGSYRELLSRAAAKGYAGIEAPMPPAEHAEEFKALLKEFNLQYIAQVWSGGEDHFAFFEDLVKRAAEFGPEHLVSHSARDRMTEAEQDRFFERALKLEQSVGLVIAHETHRYRAMFTPWTTARLLRKFPELNIAADFSHWTCVSESLLEDQEEDVSLGISRAYHIHARVGHEEGPQVTHPGAPEWSRQLERFEGWWERILNTRAAAGAVRTTMTPEFGPKTYMPTIPFTFQPVVDLQEVNDWMHDRIKSRYNQ